MADSLVCQEDGTLLVLAHRPSTPQGIEWLVYPIDPVADQLGQPISLPTTATDIVFVPGKERWAVLEKSKFRQTGLQPLARLLVFPNPIAKSPGNARGRQGLR